MNVPRTYFRAAIEHGVVAGIAAGLTPAEATALRKVGETATQVHRNYSGCPLTQAGLYDLTRCRFTTDDTDNNGVSASGRAFIGAYDYALNVRWGVERPTGWATVID